MTRKITVVLPNDIDDTQYNDIANCLWLLLRNAKLGKYDIIPDAQANPTELNQAWADYGTEASWTSTPHHPDKAIRTASEAEPAEDNGTCARLKELTPLTENLVMDISLRRDQPISEDTARAAMVLLEKHRIRAAMHHGESLNLGANVDPERLRILLELRLSRLFVQLRVMAMEGDPATTLTRMELSAAYELLDHIRPYLD